LLFANQKGGAFGADYVRRKVLHPIRERLGIPRGAFHAFRHGHATIMFSEGANPKVVQDSMGHADIKTTMRYTHAISNDRREAVERATQVFLRRSAVNSDPKSMIIN
jgi:site-specific recombinase XerD